MKIVKISIAAVVAFGLFSFTTSCNQMGNKNDKHMMDETMDNSSMGTMMGENEEMGSSEQQDEFSMIISSYLEIKDALVSDDSEAAQSAAKKMAKMDSDIASFANAIAGSNDLMEQRKNFSKMSTALYAKAKDKNLENTLYWNYCPMANDGNGANWLSMNEKIRNPYMGQKMPGCGSVKETLNNK
ncbi:Protein of unknown function [Gillisia sp. Hel1_33_143]|uniref:DUF3347 domain-containing protein n=1 Tax=unclassified Gillisia TaxID=2615025 RepID=UPI00068CC28D|nr:MULTISPECIES: DUF3347 domain-containing protein [unclassified Gillisia]SDR67946.1 Protein of unknown function [Gillisia sp. Hel1_33_143]